VVAAGGTRARRLAHVQQAEADFDPIPFDAAAARAFGVVASAFRRSGRKPGARAFDALIAATGIELVPSLTRPQQPSIGADQRTIEPS
jgi:tRNA(fMet)-specific endonuclease VapC